MTVNLTTGPYTPAPEVRLSHPEWSRSASIYQINQRQFTPEGTFRAAEAHLPRLRDFGVDIVWLMPVNPIGERNRKGDLGSPYAVKDYYAVNPEFARSTTCATSSTPPTTSACTSSSTGSPTTPPGTTCS